VKTRLKPVVALGLGAAMVGCEVLVHEKGSLQHIEIEIPLQEAVLTYSPTYTATAVVPRMPGREFQYI